MDPYVIAPTVLPAVDFNAVKDSHDLKQAFKLFTSNEDIISHIITSRSNQQRQQIANEFKTMFGKDLLQELKTHHNGHFEDIICALMMEPIMYQAKHLHQAIRGFGTDENCLVEILSVHNDQEIQEISKVYEQHYGKSLQADIIDDTSGTVKHILVALSTGNREETYEEYVEAVQSAFEDAQRILKAGELRFGTDESVFNEILCQRSRHHLRAVFHEYEKITGHSLDKAIEREFSGTAKHVILALVQCIRDRTEYLATKLYHSLTKCFGTDDKTLIRIVVSRSEIDLARIMEVFHDKYGKSLYDFIEAEVSGHYKKCLLSIIT